MSKHDITNLADFNFNSDIKELFTRSKTYNNINKQLKILLPKQLKDIELCTIEKDTAILIANNQALAFRAKQQSNIVLNSLKKIKESADIRHISIKINII